MQTVAMSLVEAARQQMIHQQIRAWAVLDGAVLDVLGQVKREEFIPAAYRHVAFADAAVPLGHGQFMLDRISTANSAGACSSTDRSDFGRGNGKWFLAACLGRLAHTCGR